MTDDGGQLTAGGLVEMVREAGGKLEWNGFEITAWPKLPNLHERAPVDDPDGTLGPAYWRNLVARFGRCTCPAGEDGKEGACTDHLADGCELCKRLDTDWPCPSRDHIGYSGEVGE